MVRHFASQTRRLCIANGQASMQLQASSLGVLAGFEQNFWAETQKGKFQVIFSQHNIFRSIIEKNGSTILQAGM